MIAEALELLLHRDAVMTEDALRGYYEEDADIKELLAKLNEVLIKLCVLIVKFGYQIAILLRQKGIFCDCRKGIVSHLHKVTYSRNVGAELGKLLNSLVSDVNRFTVIR